MRVPGGLEYTDEGVICGHCGEPIVMGEDAIVAMNGSVDETMHTHEPQVMTFDYAGAYHPRCFREAGEEDDGY